MACVWRAGEEESAVFGWSRLFSHNDAAQILMVAVERHGGKGAVTAYLAPASVVETRWV